MKRIMLFILLAFSLCFGQYRTIEIDDVTHYFDADGDNTVQTINANSAFLLVIEIQNMNLADAWIQIYDVVSGSVVVGTTTPDFSFHVPGGDGIEYWGSKVMNFNMPGVVFENALNYACTTTATGAGDPTTGLIINAQYFDD